jgi:hypothetical protein
LTPPELIAGLAAHSDPRLRVSLTPVFLVHPESATWVPRVLEQLDPAAVVELQARYMAAVYLQRLWRTRFFLPQAIGMAAGSVLARTWFAARRRTIRQSGLGGASRMARAPFHLSVQPIGIVSAVNRIVVRTTARGGGFP